MFSCRVCLKDGAFAAMNPHRPRRSRAFQAHHPTDAGGAQGSAFLPAEAHHLRREKARARLLRRSSWWHERCAAGRCEYCGRRVPPHELTMDHRLPLIRGGLSTRANVVPCCAECNAEKKHQLPWEWQAEKLRIPQKLAPNPVERPPK